MEIYTGEPVRDRAKVNVVCALRKERAHGSFFRETTFTGSVYLGMLQQLLMNGFFSFEDSLSITIPYESLCVLLHYGSSKHYIYPLSKFI
jgi:hypothetical protein